MCMAAAADRVLCALRQEAKKRDKEGAKAEAKGRKEAVA
jgi:hypothetical protein